MDQVDPYHLQKAQRELRIGFIYAQKLLLRRMMKDRPTSAAEAARCLVNDFPAHEYSIFADDAEKMLKLNVKKIASLGQWKAEIEPRYAKVLSKTYFVDYGIIEENVPTIIPKSKKEEAQAQQHA
jgi:hypothetical protein